MSFFIVMVMLFTSLLPTYGFQWPIEDVVIVSTFGESKFNQFSKGIDITGDSSAITPIDAGELVFYSSPDTSLLDLPSGFGTYAIYQHKNGIRSLYGNLEDGSLNIEQREISLSDAIGIVGSTDSVAGSIIHLQVIDLEFEKYINPLLSLPSLVDRSKPVINEVYLIAKEGKRIIASGEIINSGVFGLSADIRDLSEELPYYYPVTPFSISLFINGENITNINFEALEIKDDKMILQELNGISHDELYIDKWEFYLGEFEFTPGDVMLEIYVKDFEGNEGVKIFPIKIMG